MTRSDLREYLVKELETKSDTDDDKWLENLLESFPIDSYVMLEFLNRLIHQKKYRKYLTPSLEGCIACFMETRWHYFKSRVSYLFNEERMKRETVVKSLSKEHLASERLIQEGIQELIEEDAIEYNSRDKKTSAERKEFYETVRHYYEDFPDMTMQEIADKLGKTNSYMRFLVHDLRKRGIITAYRHIKIAYTKEEDVFIVSKRSLHWPYDDIAAELERTPQSVKQRFYYLYYNLPDFYNECMIKAISQHNEIENERMASYA